MSQMTIDQFFKASGGKNNRTTSLKTIVMETTSVNDCQWHRTAMSDAKSIYEAVGEKSCASCTTPKKKASKGKLQSPALQFSNNNDKSNGHPLDLEGSISQSAKILYTPTRKEPMVSACNAHPSQMPLGSAEKPKTGMDSPRKKAFVLHKKSGIPVKRGSPRKLIMENENTLMLAVQNLNDARQGILPLNNFNLQKIYSAKRFFIEYGNMDPRMDVRYDVEDVTKPDDFKAIHLLTIITNTFANPINCGYFSANELDFIFSMLTLSANAQMLLARMIKRNKSWYRIQKVNYPEISDDLLPIFKELEALGICTTDITSEDISVPLELLQVNEIQQICKDLKVDRKGNKESAMHNLLNLYKKDKAFFQGAKTPKKVVSTRIYDTLGPCVSFKQKTIAIIDRIVTLLLPCQEPQDNLSDTFFLLMRVEKREIVFPQMTLEPYPLFQNKMHLERFVEGRNALAEVLNGIEHKDWNTVEKYGKIAFDKIPTLLVEEAALYGSSDMPAHLKLFAPGYTWCKVLSKSIDIFKKSPEKIQTAIDMLNLLINQELYMPHRKGQWYAELALIEMHHRKDCHASAHITIKALTTEDLSVIDKMALAERAKKLLRRKTGITAEIKNSIRETIDTFVGTMPDVSTIACNTIEGGLIPGNSVGSKSTWRIDLKSSGKSYGSVEQLVLYHYFKNGFLNGIHCEGSLPVTLFSLLFWDELYSTSVPAAFVSTLQDAPLDLFTAEFYENRRQLIDKKLSEIRLLDIDKFTEFVGNRYLSYQGYQSIMPNNLFTDERHVKTLIKCLGCEATIKICEKLLGNFKLWRAGFPDLILWNENNRLCKIVEVKGPKDVLSTRQILWLEFLKEIGLEVEVCLVNAKGRGEKRKNMK